MRNKLHSSLIEDRKVQLAIKIYLILALVSVGYFVWILLQVAQHDGWGAWAVGSALIYPIGFSVIFGIIGFGIWWWQIKQSLPTKVIASVALLSASPFLWFLGRIVFRNVF